MDVKIVKSGHDHSQDILSPKRCPKLPVTLWKTIKSNFPGFPILSCDLVKLDFCPPPLFYLFLKTILESKFNTCLFLLKNFQLQMRFNIILIPGVQHSI